MNERIKELAEQAEWRFADKATGNFSEYDRRLEKFAELIINECVTICNDNIVPTEQQGDLTYNDGVMDCSIMIEKHFGVEE